jgi:hypothetical protein
VRSGMTNPSMSLSASYCGECGLVSMRPHFAFAALPSRAAATFGAIGVHEYQIPLGHFRR